MWSKRTFDLILNEANASMNKWSKCFNEENKGVIWRYLFIATSTYQMRSKRTFDLILNELNDSMKKYSKDGS